MSQQIHVNIPLDTVNAAINALVEQPFKISAPHVQVLQQRAQEAINAYQLAQKMAAEAKPADPNAAEVQQYGGSE